MEENLITTNDLILSLEYMINNFFKNIVDNINKINNYFIYKNIINHIIHLP